MEVVHNRTKGRREFILDNYNRPIYDGVIFFLQLFNLGDLNDVDADLLEFMIERVTGVLYQDEAPLNIRDIEYFKALKKVKKLAGNILNQGNGVDVSEVTAATIIKTVNPLLGFKLEGRIEDVNK